MSQGERACARTPQRVTTGAQCGVHHGPLPPEERAAASSLVAGIFDSLSAH